MTPGDTFTGDSLSVPCPSCAGLMDTSDAVASTWLDAPWGHCEYCDAKYEITNIIWKATVTVRKVEP